MTNNSKSNIAAFRWIDSAGNLLAPENSVEWYVTHDSTGFGPIVGYQWLVNGTQIKVDVNTQKVTWYQLPDATGFISFEAGWEPDNCLLLDVFGNQKARLTVPWQMTGAQSKEGAAFGNVDGPYANPADSKMGNFGVSGWVGESKFYFELDYHTGAFLWCKRIQD